MRIFLFLIALQLIGCRSNYQDYRSQMFYDEENQKIFILSNIYVYTFEINDKDAAIIESKANLRYKFAERLTIKSDAVGNNFGRLELSAQPNYNKAMHCGNDPTKHDQSVETHEYLRLIIKSGFGYHCGSYVYKIRLKGKREKGGAELDFNNMVLLKKNFSVEFKNWF